MDLEYDFGGLNLFFFEDGIGDILIIGLFFEYGVDEDKEFLDDGLIVELDAAFDDGFGDLFGDFSAFFEAEVLEEGGVLFHGEDEIAEGVEWVDEELADINLAVFVDRGLVLGTVVRGILQDFIDILVFGGVAFERELQKGAVQIKRVLDFARVRILDQFLDIQLEQPVNVTAILNIFHVQIIVSQVTRKPVHQCDEDCLHVDLLFALFRTCVQQFRQCVDVELFWETLDHAVQ